MRIIEPEARIMWELEQLPPAQRIERCGRLCYKSEDKITSQSATQFVQRIIERGHNSVLEMASCHLIINGPETALDNFVKLTLPYITVDYIDLDRILITGSIRAFREIADKDDAVINAVIGNLSSAYPLCIPPPRYLPEDIHCYRINPGQMEWFGNRVYVRHRKVAVKFIVNRAVSHELVRHRPCSFLQESQRYCRYSNEKFGSQVTFIRPMFFEAGSQERENWENAMMAAEAIYLDLLRTSTPQAARTVLPNSCKTEIIVYTDLVEWQHIFKLRTSAAADPSMREVVIPLLHEFRGIYPELFDHIQEAA